MCISTVAGEWLILYWYISLHHHIYVFILKFNLYAKDGGAKQKDRGIDDGEYAERRKLNEGPQRDVVNYSAGVLCADRMFFRDGALPQPCRLVGDEDECQ